MSMYKFVSDVKWFFWKVKRFFTTGWKLLLLEDGARVFAVIFSIVGVAAVCKGMTWLMLLSAIVMLAARVFDFVMQAFGEEEHFLFRVLSNMLFLVVAAIGIIPVYFLLEKSFGSSVLISLNGCSLLFYVIELCVAIVRWISKKRFQRKLDREIKREARAMRLEDDDE